jgi:ribosomal protein L40E
MEYKWDRYCIKCFNRLGDTAVHCDHCGYNYAKKHIEITGLHKKTNEFKNRKR